MFTYVKYLPILISKLIITVAHYPNGKIFIFYFLRYRRIKTIFEKVFPD